MGLIIQTVVWPWRRAEELWSRTLSPPEGNKKKWKVANIIFLREHLRPLLLFFSRIERTLYTEQSPCVAPQRGQDVVDKEAVRMRDWDHLLLGPFRTFSCST